MTRTTPLADVPRAAIEALLDRAFGADRKARPAYRLREGARELAALSFAAWQGERLAGTLQSWAIELDGRAMTMVGPVAVEPDLQNAGIGHALMHALLGAAGDRLLMMVGDPDYYGRFGFNAGAARFSNVPEGVDPARLLARVARLPKSMVAMSEPTRRLAPRAAWPTGFPDVVIHMSVADRDAHPDYFAAKSGDPDAAHRLALATLDQASVAVLREILQDRDAILQPVTADEVAGFNAIPDAMAYRLGDWLDREVASGEIAQINKVGHTRARAFQRLVTPALFDGHVERGAAYVLVDDHVGLGGTLANLRGFIETRGGVVVAMTALTESRDGRRISLRQETRDLLWSRHGHQLDQFWRTNFGHGLDTLTELEAVQLGRQQSVAAIEGFLAQASVEARSRGLAPA